MKEQNEDKPQENAQPRGSALNELLSGDCDIAKFVNLYKGLGIPLTPRPRVDEDCTGYSLKLKEGEHFKGYSWFYSVLRFDRDGKFISQGFWE